MFKRVAYSVMYTYTIFTYFYWTLLCTQVSTIQHKEVLYTTPQTVKHITH